MKDVRTFALLSLVVAACGARSTDPFGGPDAGDGGVPSDAGPLREPSSHCLRNEPVDVSLANGHYDILGSTMSLRFGVLYCGPSPLEESILARVIRIDPDTTETVLFEGQTVPGLPSGYQEYIDATVPHSDGDCLWIEIDPFEEIEDCTAPRCNLFLFSC